MANKPISKKLHLWNGAGYCLRKRDDPAWADVPDNNAPHGYVAAYSRADARRIIAQYCGREPPDSELRGYWSHGAWGNPMNGITPERGLWIGFNPDAPTRVV
jgi:hypothetical protein